MATVEARRNKNGIITSYRITVAGGLDSTGKQMRHRMTWKPDSDMTARQTEKALARAVADFEREIEYGYQIDHRQTFTEYAEYVLDLKERTGIKPRTIDRYRDLMVRINDAVGHLKLSEIRPQHLNAFYKNLGEYGVRQNGDKAFARTDLEKVIKRKKISKAEIARRAGMSASTVTSASKGKTISLEKAEGIASALGMKVTDLFRLEKDTSPLSDKTILEYHRLISTIMAQAEKEMLIPYNPAAKATPPRVQKKPVQYYQPEEMDMILDVLDDAPLKWKTITYLMIDTGCRRGEAAGLKWESVDLDAGVITIERALLYSNKRGIYEGPTKTGTTRTVRLSDETISLLKEYQAAQSDIRILSEDHWTETGYVFTRDNGLPINPDSVTYWLNKFSEENGLPHIHPHAFRHTAASIMIADGIDIVTTASELGHSNAATTATIYAHQISEARAKASEARSSVFKNRRKRAMEGE